jgi:hypothetical protein
VARLLALLLGGFGLGAYLRRRRKRGPEPESTPADELRSKLAASRTADPEPEPAPDPVLEPEPELEPERLQSDLAERRREVHERARGTMDELS